MDVRATASLHAFPRVGFVVPRYKHSAVDRNLVKRRLRELVRLYVLAELPAMDVVVRVFPSAYARSFDELQSELLQAIKRIARDARPTTP